MSQAFFTSIAGMNAGQNKIDVVADNIANMNTIGFKSSNLNFQTVYSKIMSSGSSPSAVTGGTNPKQIGLGVTLGSISRDFTGGTVQSTGRNTDLNIQGSGFFTLRASDNSIVLSRDGNFSLDANGYLVNSNGLRVIGTSSLYDTNASESYVMIPSSLKLSVNGKDLTQTDASSLAKLNNVNIKTGVSTFQIYDNLGAKHEVVFDSTGMSSLTEIAEEINNQIEALGTFGTGDDQSVKAVLNKDGTLSINLTSTGIGKPDTLTFEAGLSDTSNLFFETGLSAAAVVDDGTGNVSYSTKVLSYEANIGPFENINNSATKSSYSIGKDGSIEVVYSNGDKISVEIDGNKKVLKYTTANGVTIKAGDINVTNQVIEAANLQIQLASVLNEEGLLSQNGNTFSLGPNSGSITYSVGDMNGFGAIATGGLESSNVNMATEFANMILAQRAVEANSKTFSTISEVLRRIVNM